MKNTLKTKINLFKCYCTCECRHNNIIMYSMENLIWCTRLGSASRWAALIWHELLPWVPSTRWSISLRLSSRLERCKITMVSATSGTTSPPLRSEMNSSFIKGSSMHSLHLCWLYNCVCYSVCLFGLSPAQGSCVHELWDLNLSPNRSSSTSRTMGLCCAWIRWTCSGWKHDAEYTLLNRIEHLILIFFSISMVAW